MVNVERRTSPTGEVQFLVWVGSNCVTPYPVSLREMVETVAWAKTQAMGSYCLCRQCSPFYSMEVASILATSVVG